MPNIIEITDCIGSADIQQGTFTTPIFDDIRDEFTNEYIYKLLGVDLGVLFLADLDANGVPQTAPYTTIFNPIVQDVDGVILNSKGIKYYIKMIIWFYYTRNNNTEITNAGNRISESQNSAPLNDPSAIAKNYNKGIQTGRMIQWYINENSADFPLYNGQHLETVIPL